MLEPLTALASIVAHDKPGLGLGGEQVQLEGVPHVERAGAAAFAVGALGNILSAGAISDVSSLEQTGTVKVVPTYCFFHIGNVYVYRHWGSF